MEQEQAVEQHQRISYRAGFLIGFIAGVIMTALLVTLRFALDTPVLPEVVADWLTKVTPGVVFDFVLERLQVSAKPLMFAGLLAGQVVAGGGLGVLYALYSPRLPLSEEQRWARGLIIAVALWLAIMVVVTPIVEGGAFGVSLPDGPMGYMVTTFLAVAAYGISLTQLHYIALTRREGRHDLGRREFIQRAAFFTLLAAAGGFALRTILRSSSSVTPSRVFRRQGELPPEVTPNGRFYEVSKNIINPRVDVSTWKLEVNGELGNPYSLTYDELLALPWQEEYVTLTCISNLIGGSLIGNALWRGVPLKLLLERSQLPASAQRLAFHAADGYVDSFPVDYAMRDNVLVAYMMNGEPLSDDHGFPARIIVPGLYGMENVKWLTRIEPVPAIFRGYWQERGWADTAVIKTMSRIDVPSAGMTIPREEVLVGGVAFAGDRGVTSVEISVDAGNTWLPAELRRALSPFTWVLWTSEWEPPSSQRYTIAVRATDGTGEVQTATVQKSLPDGATGHHRIMVTVQEPVQSGAAQSS